MRKIIVKACVVIAAWLVASSQAAFGQETNKTFVAFSLKAAQGEVVDCQKRGVDFQRDYPEIHHLGFITRPVGLVVDKYNGDVIIVGERRPLPHIYLDDLVVALRSVFVVGEEHPGVSVDPVGDERNPTTQFVRFMGPLQNTRFGKVCFEADYLLKKIGLNKEPLRVKGVNTYFDLAVAESRQGGRGKTRVSSRFWFMPASDCHKTVGEVVLLSGMDLQVFAEIISAEVDGTPVVDLKNFYDRPTKEFALLFTNAYDEAAKENIVFEELRQIGRLVSLVKGLKQIQEQPRLDYWLTGYAVGKVETPIEVEVLRNEHEEEGRLVFEASGGVRLGSVILNVKGDVTKLIKAALPTRPSEDVVTWTFGLTGEWDVIVEPGGIDPRALGELFAQALFLQGQKRYNAAIECYDKILQLDSNYAEAYNDRGLLWRLIGQLDAAKNDYRRAIEANIHYAALPCVNLGCLLMREGSISEAKEMLRKAIQISPWLPTAYNNLGIALRREGKLEEATAEYQRAISLNDIDPVPHYNLGLCLLLNGKVDEAVAALTCAVKLQPDSSPRMLFHLGVALFEQGCDREAFCAFEKCLGMDTYLTSINPTQFSDYDFGTVFSSFAGDEQEFIRMARVYAIMLRDKLEATK